MEAREGSAEEFEKLPVPTTTAKKSSPWVPILEKIKSGKVMFIPYSSRRNLKGIRIGLARLAASDKLKLEFRQNPKSYEGEEEETGELGVRIHPTLSYIAPIKSDVPPGEVRKPGRPKKQAQE